MTRPSEGVRHWNVAELLCRELGEWNCDKVNQALWQVDMDVLASVPIGLFNRADTLVWHHDRSGVYSVRSGYRVAMTARRATSSSSASGDSHWWKLLWHLHLPSKMKIFTWRAFNECLPTLKGLSRRGVGSNLVCLRCREGEENGTHALLYCSCVARVWETTAFWSKFQLTRFESIQDFLLDMAANLPREELEVVCGLLWAIWKERNAVIHGGSEAEPKLVVEQVGQMLWEFREALKVDNQCQ